MAALCLTTGALTATLALSSFTLSWTHSIEKIEWREDWRVEDGLLVPEAAWVRGSGAGMEPPADAVLVDGWWRYRPALGPQEQLVLARSRFAGDYRLCWDGACHPLADVMPLPGQPGVTIVRACIDGAAPRRWYYYERPGHSPRR